MAEVLIKYKADAGELEATVNKINEVNNEAVKSAQKASDKIATEFKDAAKSAAAAFSGGEVKKALDSNTSSIEKLAKSGKTLTGQLKGLKQELTLLEQQGKDNTKEFNQLLIAAAKLEDQIGDTRARVRILAADTFKFDAAVQATQGLAAGFEVAQGAAALFGSESEDLQKGILKVQGAIAVANGVQQIANLLLEESAIKTAILTAKQAIYTTVVGTSTGALKVFRIALATTGVGLLVVGLGFLIEKLFFTTEATEDASEATNKLAEANQNVANTVAEAANEQELAAIRLAKAQGKISDATAKRAEVDAKVNEDLRKNQLQTLTELTDARTKYNENIKAIQEKFADDERSLIGSVQIEQRNFEAQRAQLIEAGAKRAAAIRTNSIAEVIEFENDLADKSEKANKKTQKAVTDTKKEYDALKISVGNVTAELLKQDAVITQTLAANRVSAAEAAFSKIQLLNQQGLATAEDVNKAEIELIQQRAIAQLDASELSQREKLEGVTKGSVLETEIIKAGESERQSITNAAELDIFNKKKEFRDKNAAERKKDRDAEIDNLLAIAQATAEVFGKIIELQNVQSQKRIEQINATSAKELEAINKLTISEAEKQRKIEALNLRTQQKIAAEKTKQAKADRAAAIFNAIIGTAVAVAKATTPVLKALALASGLAQVAIISSQPIPKFKRGGMVGGRSHDAGGTIIEAERGEFVVNRNAVTRHRSELDALNTSSAAFRRLIDERYVRPALNYYMGKKDKNVIVNASLNSKGMEKKLDRLNKTMSKQRTIVNINGNDSRYAWHLN